MHTIKIDLKKIETKEDFLSWTKEVNTAVFSQICDLQDVFARSDEKELKKLFLEQTKNERELSVFSITKCMGAHTLFDFINSFALARAQAWIDKDAVSLDAKWSEVTQKEFGFSQEKLKLETIVQGQNEKIMSLEKELTDVREVNIKYYKRQYALESELSEVYESLNKLQAFESHIKGLLNAA